MPDSVPNYLTTAADGSVSANFSGTVTAAGLILPTTGRQDFNDITNPLSPDTKIMWRRSNGAEVAYIAGRDAALGTPGSIEIYAHQEGNLYNDLIARNAGLTIEATTRTVNAVVQNQQFQLADINGVMKVGQIQSAGGGAANIRGIGNNGIKFGWNAEVLTIYVDDTPVIALNAGGGRPRNI